MKKYLSIVATLLFLLGGILIYQNAIFNDNKLHLVFCSVGQGDAIFIRTPNGSDILIDGGPDDSVLSCLSRHMPLWDRTIEVMILTHPHADHLTGLITVLKRYKVSSFITENLKNKTAGFSELMRLLAVQTIPMRYAFAGDRLRTGDGVIFQFVGPTQELLTQVGPNGFIGETGEQASLENLLTYGDFSALLTGDSQTAELEEALRFISSNISILQVPHHGSKTGLNPEILKILNPKIAVISVGKNNKYGHPNSFTLDLLKSENIKTIRTDQQGEIQVISNSKTWTLN